MKKYILPLVALAICISASVVCIAAYTGSKVALKPSDKLISKTYSAHNISKIETEFVDVDITVGEANGDFTITAPDNIMPYIEVEIDGGKLELSLSKKAVDGKKDNRFNINSKVLITLPTLKKVSTSLGAKVKVNGTLVADYLDIEAETSGTFIADKIVSSDKIEIESETAASVKVDTLKAGVFKGECNTAAKINIGNVSANYINIESNTAASIKIKNGSSDIANYDANTAGSIDARGVIVNNGKADASTGGSIKCSINNPIISKDTGGSVKNE